MCRGSTGRCLYHQLTKPRPFFVHRDCKWETWHEYRERDILHPRGADTNTGLDSGVGVDWTDRTGPSPPSSRPRGRAAAWGTAAGRSAARGTATRGIAVHHLRHGDNVRVRRPGRSDGVTAVAGTADVSGASLVLCDAPSEAAFLAVFRALDDATRAVAGPSRLRPLVVLLHDDAGAVCGGLWGRTLYAWLLIDMLVVPMPLRGRGLGTAMVRRAASEARRRDCIGMMVDTLDFQAPGFYRRLGFTLCGVQNDFPPGYRRLFMCQRFDGAP